MTWFNVIKGSRGGGHKSDRRRTKGPTKIQDRLDRNRWQREETIRDVAGDVSQSTKYTKRLLKFLNKEFKGNSIGDMKAAIYWYASDYHKGQNSRLYRVLTTSAYRPGSITEVKEEDPIVLEMYGALIDEFEGINNPDSTMAAIGRRLEGKKPKKGFCATCGKDTKFTKFKDEASKDEYKISGMCQKCQDLVFGPPPGL
jgi:hypothetical protein